MRISVGFISLLFLWFTGCTTNNKPTADPELKFDNALNILIGDSAMNVIRANRDEALKQQLLLAGSNDWVPGSVIWGSDTIPVKLRLKGELTNHLEGDKWPFRLEVTGTAYWNSLQDFSIQSPHTRSFLNEWVFHQLLMREDVLASRTDLIPVAIDNEVSGIYYYQEHFTKNLLESQQRREGVIIRFNEDEMWNVRAMNNLVDRLGTPIYQASEIKAYSGKKIRLTPNLNAQFSIAQNLMYQYKFGLKPASEIFDVELLAKYLAILDLTQVRQGFSWYNQRWYYNPVTGKLEPIGFDGYDGASPFSEPSHYMLGWFDEYATPHSDLDPFTAPLFNDPVIFEAYIGYLREYTSEFFIPDFLANLRPEIEARKQLLQQEYEDYQYDYSFLNGIAEQLKQELASLNVEAAISQKSYWLTSTSHTYNNKSESIPTNNVSVLGYSEAVDSSARVTTIRAENFYVNAITVTGGIGYTLDTLEIDPVTIAGYDGNLPTGVSISFPGYITALLFSTSGTDSLFQTEIIPHSGPFNYTPQQELWQQTSTNSNPNGSFVLDTLNSYYTVSDTTISFKPGSHTISSSLLFPSGYRIDIPAGTSLNLINGAAFISWSPIHIGGTADNPVKIYSTDGTGNGFTVIKGVGWSSIDHCSFEGLNTLNKNGWMLTGAVTFYQSNVTITNTQFLNTKCEDGLNLLRCEFRLDSCTIDGAVSDGFDADFCTGEIRNGRFKNTDNDCIDLSGSDVEISGCEINNAGDKGISAGERSSLVISDVTIDGANIGVAAKDQSELVISAFKLKNCAIGFALFQKKPEYGPGKITLDSFSQENVIREKLIELGSIITIEGKEIIGKDPINVDELYGL